MTQGEKDLVLKDLCARLPYKVMGHATWTYLETDREVKYAEKDRPIEINDIYDVWNFKPYLRPMSSMTEEESLYILLCNAFIETRSIELKVDFYNERHIDYRDLIGKGLALEAPKDMYKL